jgi:hypothetical protein
MKRGKSKLQLSLFFIKSLFSESYLRIHVFPNIHDLLQKESRHFKDLIKLAFWYFGIQPSMACNQLRLIPNNLHVL